MLAVTVCLSLAMAARVAAEDSSPVEFYSLPTTKEKARHYRVEIELSVDKAEEQVSRVHGRFDLSLWGDKAGAVYCDLDDVQLEVVPGRGMDWQTEMEYLEEVVFVFERGEEDGRTVYHPQGTSHDMAQLISKNVLALCLVPLPEGQITEGQTWIAIEGEDPNFTNHPSLRVWHASRVDREAEVGLFIARASSTSARMTRDGAEEFAVSDAWVVFDPSSREVKIGVKSWSCWDGLGRNSNEFRREQWRVRLLNPTGQ